MDALSPDEIQAIVDIADDADDRGLLAGLRCMRDPVVGTSVGPSRVWDDGDPTDEYLPGTSVIAIHGFDEAAVRKALGLIGAYRVHGQIAVLVGDNVSEAIANDPGEAVIRDAVVAHVASLADGAR